MLLLYLDVRCYLSSAEITGRRLVSMCEDSPTFSVLQDRYRLDRDIDRGNHTPSTTEPQ